MGTGQLERFRRWLGIGLSGAAFQLGVPWVDEIAGELLPATPVDEPAFSGVRGTTTGDHSERVARVPITRTRGSGVRSAISLGPAKLKRLRTGDELRASAEVQVSTTCIERSRRCHGRRYRFDPTVATRLVLAPGPGVTAPERTAAVSPWRATECSQVRPDRNHHCVLVVPEARRRVSGTKGLPCPPAECHLNLLLSARHPRAKRKQVIVVGGDKPGGRIAQDKGRVNAIVVREDAQARIGRESESSPGAGALRLRGGRAVVHSARLDDPRQGELLEVEASFRSSLRRLRHNALVSAVIVAAPSPTSAGPGQAARLVSLRGRLTELNGFNCTIGPSGFKSPCRTLKAGFGRIRRDPAEVLGAGEPLYLNLVARVEPVLTRSRRGGRVMAREGTVAVKRFGPSG